MLKKVKLDKTYKKLSPVEKKLTKVIYIEGTPGKDGEKPSTEELVQIIAQHIPEPIPGKDGKDGINGKSFTKKQIRSIIDESFAEKMPELMVSLQGAGEVRVEDAKDGYNIVISGKKHFIPNAVYGPKLRNFVQMGDTPDTYVGQAGKVATVKSDETGLEFAPGGDRYRTTSTTSQTIVPTGTLTFTVDSGLSYTPQQDVIISYDSSNHMHGQVVSYSGTTLVVDIAHKTGSGTYASWIINLDGIGGGSVTTDGTLVGDGFSSPLGINFASINTWTGTQYFNAGTPVYVNSNLDYQTSDIDILQIGDNSGTNLRLRWTSIMGTGGNEFRLDDTFGNLQPLLVGNLTSSNVYTGSILASGSIDGSTITASLGFSGTWAGNTIPVSRGGTGTGTTFTQNSIVLAGVSGNYTQDLGFIFNQSTKRLLVSNASITPQSQGHFHQSGATALELRFTNSATGSTSTDGFQIGITSAGVAEIRQREAQSLTVYINNYLRTTWSSGGSGQLTHDGEIVETRNSIATTDTYGIRAENQASATSGVPVQNSPMLTLLGHGWNTGTLVTNVAGFNMVTKLTSGNPVSGVLGFGFQANTSGSFVVTGFSYLMNLSSSGRLNIGGGTTVATARLQLPAGTATANTAPLKFTTGTNLTTAEAGVLEYNNTLHFTNSDATRRHVVLAPNTTKVTAGAPYTNDGYAIINIGGTDIKVMTTA